VGSASGTGAVVTPLAKDVAETAATTAMEPSTHRHRLLNFTKPPFLLY
jgi:hypothetical protein